jgi:serine/threonine protein kinase/CHASE1-domain containing sensor protein
VAPAAARFPWTVSALALALGAAVTVAVWEVRTRRATELRREAVAQRSIGLARLVEQRFGEPVEMMHAVASLVSATGDARADAFGHFVRDAIRRQPLIYAMEWAPRVTRAARASFEAEARATGFAGYQIREPRAGQLVPAGDRPVYFPLRYLEPMNPAWGLDLTARATGRALIERACQSGAAAASPRYQLVEDQPGHYSVYAIDPVWPGGAAPAEPAARCDDVLGYVVVILRLDPILADIMRHVDLDEVELSLRDVTAGAGTPAGDSTVIGESVDGAAARAQGRLVARQPVSFVDRQWEVAVAPRDRTPGGAWILVLGLGASILAAAMLGGATAWLRMRQRLAEALRLGQYQLEQQIGRGGMGVVFRARHVMLRRETALKLLTAPPGDEGAVARFEREVRLTAGLTHPNTIQIFDYGRTPDGRFYYAMEYLDGVTLQDVIDHDGAQPVARTVHIVTQIAGALREAHGIGLVHRDLKPGNLMLTRRGGIADFVKVLDFGLVKRIGRDALGTVDAAERDAEADSMSTEDGVVTGTPGYVAPETLRGREVDQRADLYALGAVWYALLAGRPPFFADTAGATITAQLIARPVPIERVRDDLPDGLGSLVLRCMNPDPRLRVASAAALLDEIAALAVPRWTQDEAQRWWRERGPAVLAARQAAAAAQAAGTATPQVITVDTARLDDRASLRTASRSRTPAPRSR